MNAKKNVPEDMTEILIVEDSPTQAEQLKYLLEKHGYKVSVANNGKQALSLFGRQNPALVISDIIMPEMNGYELCRQMKSVTSKQDIPVILLTSLSDAEDVLSGLECGADNFITKPYSEEYLLLHVEQIIANRKLFRNERVRVGLEIMFGGKRRFVTADQQQMLTLLISTYEEAVRKNAELVKTQNMYKALNERLEGLVKERTAALAAEIEEHKKADERIHKLNRVYAMLSNINQAIVRVREPQVLFKEVCRIAVEDGGFKMAWIGLADPSTRKVNPVASAGAAGDYLEKVHIVLGEEAQDSYAIERVLKAGEHFVWNDMENDPRMAPWHEDAVRMGFRSCVAFPFKVSGQVRGVLKLYAAETGFFDEEELKLLDELAMDVSFAMEFAEKEADRGNAEDALRESEECYRAFFEHAAEGILIADLETKIFKYANPAICRMLGYAENELITMNVVDIHPKDALQSVMAEFEAQARGDKILAEGLPCLRKDGAILYADINAVKIIIDGKACNAGFFRDISARMEAKEKQKKLEDQLRQSQKMEAIGQLASGVSHDFNNLLGGIMGHAELLKMHLDAGSDLLRHTNRIISCCVKAADLTRQLLSFARKAPSMVRPVDPNTIITQIVEILKRTIDRRIEIVIDLEQQPPLISGDQSQLENALLNVAINARDAMPQGGRLSITSKTVDLDRSALPDEHFDIMEGRYIRISIADTGIGMSKEIKDRIFEPFFTTKEVGKGTGLGLASVYGCIKQHYGYITVESREGDGTRFDLYLPVAATAQPAAAATEDAALAPGKGTLLVVDDEVVYHEVLTGIFNGLGYTVHCCIEGGEAVKFYREHHASVDIVVLDMNMPKMNGLECFRRLKEINAGVHVIISSGYDDSANRAALQKEGVRFFLQKPYKAAELGNKIAEILGPGAVR
jgi:PAS domain S-box-containing protein